MQRLQGQRDINQLLSHVISIAAAGSHAYIHFNLWADREKSFLGAPEASQRALGRRKGVPERGERCLLLKESIFHQADTYFGDSFPGWMFQPGLPAALDPRGPSVCDGSPLGCQACCPQSCLTWYITAAGMLRRSTSGERRGAGVPGFAMWLLMLSWLLATGVRERKTIRNCTAIKQPPNCSATYGSSAAF